MAVYAYTADQAGAAGPLRGMIQADSPRQARDQLRSRGLSVRELAQHETSRQPWLQRYALRRQSVHITSFYQELSTLLAAGIPLMEALDTIIRQHQGVFRQAIMLLRDQVAAGSSLTQAMARQPELFDDLSLNIVEVGENAGTLDVSLTRLVDFRRRSAGLKNRIVSALIYPCIVISMGVLLSLFMMMYVMPNLLSVLTESGKPLPAATLLVKGMSDLLLGWWWLLLPSLAGLALGAAALLRSDLGQRRWHRLQLRLPVIGPLIRKQSIARIAMVMATLLKSDLAFIKAVQIAQRTVPNTVLRDALAACEQAVFAGRDIAAALEKTGAFPPLVIQVFAVGQASGRLETMLDNLAADYDIQVDLAAGRLTALLEPLMMVLLAIGVGFFAFATILPILEAGDVL